MSDVEHLFMCLLAKGSPGKKYALPSMNRKHPHATTLNKIFQNYFDKAKLPNETIVMSQKWKDCTIHICFNVSKYNFKILKKILMYSP